MSRHFDGSNDRIVIANNAALDLPDANWSMGGWIKITSNAGSSYQFLYHRNGGGSDYMFLIIGEASVGANANKIWVYAKDTANTLDFKSSTAPGQDTDWQHLLLVRSSTTYTLYVNGAANGTETDAGVGSLDYAASVYLGNRDDAIRPFNGDMAEWAKWDVSLNSEQRTALVNGVRPTEVGTRPVWYLPMLAGLDEEIAGLAVTNFGTIIAEHPPRIVPASGPLVARFNATRNSYYYQHLLAGAS